MAAPTDEDEERDVRVPVKDEDEQVKSAATDAPAPAATESAPGDLDEDDEEALVEAAKRAGEAAAEEDFKADAARISKERDDLQKQLDGVSGEIDKAKQEAADAKERLVRLQADWDNYRRRTAQERNDERERASEGLVKDLLPVLDDMERALDHVGQIADGDESVSQFVDGVKAVHDKMLSILGKRGVEVIDPAGEAFDPMIHQAVGREENKDAYDETVAQVYQRGYRMGGKVIRTAMVTVTYGGPKRPAPADDVAADDGSAQGGPDGAGSAKQE